MDGADPDRWSYVARSWSELWGDVPRPLWDLVGDRTGVGPGCRVLDAGCGAGDLLAHWAATGADVAGFDPAAGMVALARARLPAADVRTADLASVPWADASFDVVVSVNALQFADDTVAAAAELVRVCRPGGAVVLAGWAEDDRNDLSRLEAAAAAATDTDLPADGPLRRPGGFAALLAAAGAHPETEGEVQLTWTATGEDALLRGVLLGEPAATLTRARAPVLAAAAPFRRAQGYVLTNHFRYAVARPT